MVTHKKNFNNHLNKIAKKKKFFFHNQKKTMNEVFIREFGLDLIWMNEMEWNNGKQQQPRIFVCVCMCEWKKA